MYIQKETLYQNIDTWIPILSHITEQCINCNKKQFWLLLAIHIPDMIWLCHDCYKKYKYDPDTDYIEHNWMKVYGSRAVYKVWRWFIPNLDIDEYKYDDIEYVEE